MRGSGGSLESFGAVQFARRATAAPQPRSRVHSRTGRRRLGEAGAPDLDRAARRAGAGSRSPAKRHSLSHDLAARLLEPGNADWSESSSRAFATTPFTPPSSWPGKPSRTRSTRGPATLSTSPYGSARRCSSQRRSSIRQGAPNRSCPSPTGKKKAPSRRGIPSGTTATGDAGARTKGEWRAALAEVRRSLEPPE